MPDNTLSLQQVAQILLTAERLGADEDSPEGTRYIQLSETLVTNIAESINYHVAGLIFLKSRCELLPRLNQQLEDMTTYIEMAAQKHAAAYDVQQSRIKELKAELAMARWMARR